MNRIENNLCGGKEEKKERGAAHGEDDAGHEGSESLASRQAPARQNSLLTYNVFWKM